MGKVLSFAALQALGRSQTRGSPTKSEARHVQESTPVLPHTQTHKPWHTPRLHASVLAPSPALYCSLQSGNFLCFPQRHSLGTNLGPSERAVFPDVGWRSSSRLRVPRVPSSPVRMFVPVENGSYPSLLSLTGGWEWRGDVWMPQIQSPRQCPNTGDTPTVQPGKQIVGQTNLQLVLDKVLNPKSHSHVAPFPPKGLHRDPPPRWAAQLIPLPKTPRIEDANRR